MIPKSTLFFGITTVIPCCQIIPFSTREWIVMRRKRQTEEEAKEKEEGSGCQ
jgi:hypothetical protein